MKTLVLATVLAFAASASAGSLDERRKMQSQDAVKQLAAAMAERQIQAVAAKDPADPTRYVAAMLYPGVQLLLITARTDATAYMDAQLAAQEYTNVYTALHQGVPESKLFVQDMGCDGLRGTDGQTVDVVYERGVDQRILNGDAKAAGVSRGEYAQLVNSLDERYTKLVSLLLTAATAPQTASR